MIFRINFVQAFSATLALTSFLAKGTKATSLRGQSDQGEDLRQLQLTAPQEDVDLEKDIHTFEYNNFIRHTTGGCKGRNELGWIKNFEVDPQPSTTAQTTFGNDYDNFTKKNHYNINDCARMCDSHDECVSFEYSKTKGSNGKACALSKTCDSYGKTVKKEDDNNLFYLKRTPDTEAALPCYYEPITVSGDQFRQLVTKCINIGEAELLEGWDTSDVTNMRDAFNNQNGFNIDIGNWNTAKVNTMDAMFYGAKKFNQDISNWNTAKVNSMGGMFAVAHEFNQDISNWNTAKVNQMYNMFYAAHEFNQDISNWDTAEVVYMHQMFRGAHEFNQDIGDWNTAKVKNMKEMFRGASAFNQYIGDWNTAKVENMKEMFKEASAFNRYIGDWNTAKVENMKSMFKGASKFNQDITGWITGWDTSEVTVDNDMLIGMLSA